MGRVGRDHERIARFNGACRLALYCEIKTSFEDIGAFNSRVGMPSNECARFNYRFC
jgi:hypothetical protein